MKRADLIADKLSTATLYAIPINRAQRNLLAHHTCEFRPPSLGEEHAGERKVRPVSARHSHFREANEFGVRQPVF